MMKNTGTLLANDINPERIKSLTGNIHRLGVRNSFVTNMDGVDLVKNFNNDKFDRILLDAPCSGTGVIAKDPSIKMNKTFDDVKKCAEQQKTLILAAIDMLKCHDQGGGYLVYSTCSVCVEENEGVVDYALRKRHVKLVSTNLSFGIPGMERYKHNRFHPSLKLTRRYYPHTHNMDGFYVAKFKKYANGPKEIIDSDDEADAVPQIKSTFKAVSHKHVKVHTDATESTVVDVEDLKQKSVERAERKAQKDIREAKKVERAKKRKLREMQLQAEEDAEAAAPKKGKKKSRTAAAVDTSSTASTTQKKKKKAKKAAK
jgi:ribosomal RNA methyltransferase Nop2